MGVACAPPQENQEQIMEKVQTDFPAELLPVHMFALAPIPGRVY